MKKLFAMAMLAGLSFAGAALGACDKPEEPEVPQGESATAADMLKAKKAVEAYLDLAEKYLNCGVGTLQQRNMASEMERAAERFNTQLRAYQKKSDA